MRDYEQRKAAFIYRCISHNGGHDICMCGEPHSTHGDYTGCMTTWGYLSDRQKMDLHIRKMEMDMQMDMQRIRMGYESRELIERQKDALGRLIPMVQQTVNLAARLTPVAPKCKVEDCMRDAIPYGPGYGHGLCPDHFVEQPEKPLTWSINIPDVVVFVVGLALSVLIAMGVAIGNVGMSVLSGFFYSVGVTFLWSELGLSRDWKWKRRPKAAKQPVLSSKEPLSPPSV